MICLNRKIMMDQAVESVDISYTISKKYPAKVGPVTRKG